MTRKQKIGLAVILVLLAAVLVKKYAHFSWLPSPASWEGQLDEIRIEAPDKNIVMKHIDGKWVLGEQKLPADRNQLENIANELSNLKVLSEVSGQKDYVRYELNEGRAVRVVALKGGKTMRDLFRGKNGTRLVNSHLYVLPTGMKSIWSAGLIAGSVQQG
jgi:hypothetical protein